MSFDDFIDTEVIYSPAYWMLTIGAELALLIGFKAQGLWNTEMGMPITFKILTLAAVPIVAYFIVLIIGNK